MIGLTIDRGSIFNIIEGLLCFNGSQYSIGRDHLFSIIITGCRYCMGVTLLRYTSESLTN